MRRPFEVLLAVAAGLILAFLLLPILALFLRIPPEDMLSQLTSGVAVDALVVSLKTSVIAHALVLVLGTPAAYGLARTRFRGRTVVIALVELPLVLPPAVAGIGLLAALGPRGLLGGVVADAGVQLVLATAGVVVALTFVASPFYLRQAQAAFVSIDRSLFEASRTLGSSEARTFLRIAIPAAVPGLAAGLALAWGRALGEFGATLMFAGSFRGITQTAPLAIYERFATDFDGALALSAVLVAVSGAILLTVKALAGSGAFGGAAR